MLGTPQYVMISFNTTSCAGRAGSVSNFTPNPKNQMEAWRLGIIKVPHGKTSTCKDQVMITSFKAWCF